MKFRITLICMLFIMMRSVQVMGQNSIIHNNVLIATNEACAELGIATETYTHNFTSPMICNQGGLPDSPTYSWSTSVSGSGSVPAPTIHGSATGYSVNVEFPPVATCTPIFTVKCTRSWQCVIRNDQGEVSSTYNQSDAASISNIKVLWTQSTPMNITGPLQVECFKSVSVAYTCTDVCASYYHWDVPSGWVITSGQNTRTINVTTDETTGGTVAVIADNRYCDYGGTQKSQSIQVDRTCPVDIFVVSQSDLLPELAASNNININNSSTGPISVGSGEDVRLRAGNQISIKKDFTVQANSFFHAYIGPCVSCTGLRRAKPKEEDKNQQSQVVDEILDLSMKVCPNPSNGYFTLTFSGNISGLHGSSKLQVLNINGAVVHEALISSYNSPHELDLSNQPNGMYILSIITSNGVYTNRIMKN